MSIHSFRDAYVTIFDTSYLKLLAQYPLPPFPLTPTSNVTAHGRFVFTTPRLDTLYVIVQASAADAGLDNFALATMSL